MQQVSAQLADEGLLFGFTDWGEAKRPVAAAVRQQKQRSHADEMETSMLLYIAPDLVNMKKAAVEYGAPSTTGGRMIGHRPAKSGVLSPSGVFGDPTFATRETGQRLTEAVIAATIHNIDSRRAAPLPPAIYLDARFAGVVGLYEVAPGDTIRVARDGDLLAVGRRGRARALLQPAGEHRFGLRTTEACFLTDAGAAVTHLLLSECGRDVVAKQSK